MDITNNFGLPQPFLDFARNDKYSKGKADISVTTLIDSPRVNQMRKHYASDRQADVTDMVWPLFGTAVHHILESSKEEDVLLEERLFVDIDGWTLSGAIDHQKIQGSSVEITDYKVTSVWSVIHGKIEWERQLNMYALLVQRSKGLKVSKLTICAILRDWNRRDAQYKSNYPQAPVAMVDIPLWSDQHRIEYANHRVEAHQQAELRYDLEEDLEHKFVKCTPSDQWKRDDSWAVKKKGLKRAMRVFENEPDADAFAAGQSVPVEIEHRAGELVRCKGNYCGVAEFCSQYKKEISE
jgi:hypothetical protein